MYADPLLAKDHVGAKAHPDENRDKRHDWRGDCYQEDGQKPIEGGLPDAGICSWPPSGCTYERWTEATETDCSDAVFFTSWHEPHFYLAPIYSAQSGRLRRHAVRRACSVCIRFVMLLGFGRDPLALADQA